MARNWNLSQSDHYLRTPYEYTCITAIARAFAVRYCGGTMDLHAICSVFTVLPIYAALPVPVLSPSNMVIHVLPVVSYSPCSSLYLRSSRCVVRSEMVS